MQVRFRVAGMAGALVVGGLSGACGEALPGEGSVAARDSAGIRIVEIGAEAAPERWTARERVSIGSLDGTPETTFNRIVDLEVGPTGHVYVLDAGDNVVRAYDGEGGFLFQVGGEGDGPSEFRGAAQLVARDDGFAVFDYRGPKLARFGWNGEFLGTTRSGLTVFEYGFPEDWVDVAGGSVVVLGTGCSLPAPDDRRPMWKLLTLGPEASIRDTVALRPRQELMAIYGESFCTSTPRPGGPRNSIAVRPDGTAAFGDGEDYEVAILRLTADTTRSWDGTLPTPVRLIRRRADPLRLSREAIDAHRETYTTSPEGEPVDRDRLRAFEAAWDSLGFPDRHPFFDALRWDDEGRLWVGRVGPEDAPSRTWEVFSEEGELLGATELPVGLTVRAIAGDVVWGVLRDELDVMYVKGYEVAGLSESPGA